jgi:hypothetical protein
MLSEKDEKLRKQCVDHWFENLMLLQLNHYSDWSLRFQINHQSSSCSFCNEYQKSGEGCTNCPIKLKTCHSYCISTPWIKINKKMVYLMADVTYEMLFDAFGEEIDFLLSL